ncbi:MAG TPA: YCF48-related protein [Nevskia sp.]|nr:YCF48-related protein [Nevskia sp.]
MNQTVPVAEAGQGEKAANSGWPAAVFTGMVLGAALFAFSPRPAPVFTPTQVFPDRVLVNGLAQNGKRILAAGEQGHILIADDPHGPWRDATVEPQRGSSFTQVHYIGDGVALAVGHDDWIVRSEDNGQTWKEVSFNKDQDQAGPLFGVAGPYNGKVFAFGAFGTLMASSDLGKTWEPRKSDALGDKHLYGMLDGGNALLLVGEQGQMLKSTDGGDSWQALPPVYKGSFFGALQLADKSWMAYGMRGHVFVSKDSGASWKEGVTPAPLSMFGGAVGADGKVYLAGAQRTVLVSSDNGAHFSIYAQGERQTFAALLPISGTELLVAGEPGIRIEQQEAPAASAPAAAGGQP